MLETLNVSPEQIESYLLTGQSVDEIATEWQEPRANVLAVLRQLQASGRMPTSAAPPSQPAPVARPAPPRHVPSPEVKARIASATELLVRADHIENKQVQGALGRARKALTDLAGLVTRYEEQAEAREQIAKLERDLADAKAALRGALTGKAKTTRQATVDPQSCPECGKECANKAGLSAHRRTTHGVQAVSA